MAKMGRPAKEIDEKSFKGLCALFCTLDEIASFFDCSPDTIERWCKKQYGQTFADTFKIECGPGKISLRRLQFKLAEKNAGMAIFLGKNYLGQRDNIECVDTSALDKLDGILQEAKEAAKKNEIQPETE